MHQMKYSQCIIQVLDMQYSHQLQKIDHMFCALPSSLFFSSVLFLLHHLALFTRYVTAFSSEQIIAIPTLRINYLWSTDCFNVPWYRYS